MPHRVSAVQAHPLHRVGEVSNPPGATGGLEASLSQGVDPTMKPFYCTLALVGLSMTMLAPRTRADEGLWLFNNPPLKILKHKYDFEPTKEWLDHVQKS